MVLEFPYAVFLVVLLINVWYLNKHRIQALASASNPTGGVWRETVALYSTKWFCAQTCCADQFVTSSNHTQIWGHTHISVCR